MANKWAIFTNGEAVDIYDTESDALLNAEIEGEDSTVRELTENYWWIDSDMTVDGVNYITVERNAAEFAAAINKTGLKYEKLAELCGKSKQTICLYATGKRNIPKLVIEKLQEIDRSINCVRKKK